MAGRGTVVRNSKFRHVFAEPSKEKFLDCRPSSKATESIGIRASDQFLAFPWDSGAGGALAVMAHNKVGRVPHTLPLLYGHGAAILDFEFDPFEPRRILTCSEDTTCKLFMLPEGGLTEAMRDPVKVFTGPEAHNKKVSFSTFNPVAQGIFASAGFDNKLKVWNVEADTPAFSMDTAEVVLSMRWHKDGQVLGTTSKDKMLRVIDPRLTKVAQETKGHGGSKASKMLFAPDPHMMITTGFSQQAERQLFLWDRRQLEEPVRDWVLDQGTGSVFPHLDEDTNMLYLWGKGDGNIRYYELQDGDLFTLETFRTTVPQKGVCFLPKRCVNVMKKEVLKAFKLEGNAVQPLSFVCPRKSDLFQEDLYPDCEAGFPGVGGDEWLEGADGTLARRPMRPGAAADVVQAPKAPTLREQLEEAKQTIAEQKKRIEALEAGGDQVLKQENEKLKAEVLALKAQLGAGGQVPAAPPGGYPAANPMAP